MGFDIPAGPIAVLSVEQQASKSAIDPSEMVICINRGRRVLEDTFNAEHVKIHPGLFQTQYGAALHFQRRLIVPGTRSAEHKNTYTSFIGILGTADQRIAVDTSDKCRPFTEAELHLMSEQVEAIDRGAISDPAGRSVTLISTSAARAASGSLGGQPLSTGVDGSVQVSDLAREAATHALEPPTESETRNAEAMLAAVGGDGAPEAPMGRGRGRR